MRSFFFVLMACAFFSCSNTTEEVQQEEIDEDDYFEDGGGVDLCLNYPEYRFSSEGDSITVYSEKGYWLHVGFYGSSGENELFYSESGYTRGYECDWWYAACPDELPGGEYVVEIKVQPNETGEEREIPILITYQDSSGSAKGSYVQEK